MEASISDDTLTPSKARVASAAEPWVTGRSWLGAVYPFVGLGLLIALWYATWFSGFVSQRLLPRPDQVLAVFWIELSTGGLHVDILTSLARVVTGVLIGCSAAIPVGILLAWYPKANKMFAPIINFFRSVPPIALIPLVIVYLGIGEQARVSILVYAAFFTSATTAQTPAALNGGPSLRRGLTTSVSHPMPLPHLGDKGAPDRSSASRSFEL